MKPNVKLVTTLVIALVALVNAVLALLGKTPFNLDENTVYSVISGIAVIGTSAYTYWKNQSWSTAAQLADETLKKLKSEDDDSTPSKEELDEYNTEK